MWNSISRALSEAHGRKNKMKRRTFGYLCSGTALAGVTELGFGVTPAKAAPDASLLKTTLTPFGSIRAGNADGSIPAWTGGYTTLPEGYQPGDPIGELFPDEKPILIIDSSNVAQHADRLSEGVIAMIHNYGYSIQVYPTHRTNSAPQKVYDCIVANISSAVPVPQGLRFGFTGGYGGIPFPFLDPDPAVAGAQVVWNANCQFKGFASKIPFEGWSVNSGVKSLAFKSRYWQRFPYYQATSLANYNGLTFQTYIAYTAPANLVGQALVLYGYTNAAQHPQIGWELLNGEGRVRRAPELSFDTPSSQINDIGNYDELYGFNGSLERYDWKYLGLKEMYVPYNNNRIVATEPEAAHLTHFIDPSVVRFELHRCHVVEAVLHPGERNVDARRVLYIDEDTHVVSLADNWDANNTLVRTAQNYVNVRPDIPATMNTGGTVHNLQTGNYGSLVASWGPAVPKSYIFTTDVESAAFDPQALAANSQY
jgi:hypothetical protein